MLKKISLLLMLVLLLTVTGCEPTEKNMWCTVFRKTERRF